MRRTPFDLTEDATGRLRLIHNGHPVAILDPATDDVDWLRARISDAAHGRTPMLHIRDDAADRIGGKRDPRPARVRPLVDLARRARLFPRTAPTGAHP